MATPANYVSIVDYGAKGDGKTDNTSAIQKAFDYAKANGKGVYIPEGTFVHKNVITANGIDVLGAGSKSILKGDAPGKDALIFTGKGGSLENFHLTSTTGERLRNSDSAKIKISDASDFEISKLSIDNSGSAGMLVLNGSNGRIHDNRLDGTNADSIQMVKGTNNMIVENNHITRSGDDGISVVCYKYHGAPAENIIVRNNLIEENVWGRGLTVLGGKNVSFIGNTIEGGPNDRGAIYIAAEGQYDTYGSKNILVQGNKINDGGGKNSGHGAIMMYTSNNETNENVTIVDNTITNSRKSGITVWGAGNKDVVINDNYIENTNDAGIMLDDGAKHATIVNNHIKNTLNQAISAKDISGGVLLVENNVFENINRSNNTSNDVVAVNNSSLTNLQVTNNEHKNPAGYKLNNFLEDNTGTKNVYVSGNQTALSSKTATPSQTNKVPVAGDDTLKAEAGKALTIDPSTLLANDKDANGDTLKLVGVGNETNGTLSVVNGKVVFTPTAGFKGAATFDYVVTDGKNLDTAKVTLNVDGGGSGPEDPPPTGTGAGIEDTIVVRASGTAAGSGAPQFQLMVDGKAVGPVQSVTTKYGAGWQEFTLKTDLTTASKNVEVKFLNDYVGGVDRNLYVDSVNVNSVKVSNAFTMTKNGTKAIDLTAHPDAIPTGQPQPVEDVIKLSVATKAADGNTQFKLMVDGKQVGDLTTVTAQHGKAWQEFTFKADIDSADDVSIVPVTSNASENLYVGALEINGTDLTMGHVVAKQDAPMHFDTSGMDGLFDNDDATPDVDAAA